MKKSTSLYLNNLITLPFYCFAILVFGIRSSSAHAQTPAKYILFTRASESAEVQRGSKQSLGEYIATSDNNPVSVTLIAEDDAGRIPEWLFVNGKNLKGIRYTAGSEISFDFDAANLSGGTYYATVKASAIGYHTAVLKIKLRVTCGKSVL